MVQTKEEENMSFKSGQRRLQQRLQRQLLQEAGAEKNTEGYNVKLKRR